MWVSQVLWRSWQVQIVVLLMIDASEGWVDSFLVKVMLRVRLVRGRRRLWSAGSLIIYKVLWRWVVQHVFHAITTPTGLPVILHLYILNLIKLLWHHGLTITLLSHWIRLISCAVDQGRRPNRRLLKRKAHFNLTARENDGSRTVLQNF